VLRRWLRTAGVGIPFLAAAVALASAIGAEVGWPAAGLAAVAALVPLGVVVPSFLWLDQFEAEPPRYLVFAFLWGALIAAAVALVLNTGSVLLLAQVAPDGPLVAAVVVAPVVEETLKVLAVGLVWWFRRREFDGLVDGMVYAGMSAAGFAFAENVLYLGRAVADAGVEQLVSVFVLRCVVGPFAHPVFTCLAGVGIGLAATARRPLLRVLAPAAGLAAAVVAHAAWNASAVLGLEGFVTGYLLLQLPLFVGALVFAAWARRREGRLIREHLAVFVAGGWISPVELTMLSHEPARRAARRWASGVGGRPGAAAMRAFQDAGSELAFVRMRMAHGTAPSTALAQERILLDQLTRSRLAFLTPSRARPR
jgi:RsiW-degrading membrane proteinase PrsW (M82 family)